MWAKLLNIFNIFSRKWSYGTTFLISLLFLLLLISCDFSSRLQKEIISAQTLITKQNYSKAIEKYESIIKLNPPNPVKLKIYYQLGELYAVHMGQFKKAMKYFKELIEISDNPLWQIKAQERMAEINFTYIKDYFSAGASYKKLYNYQPALDKQDFYYYRLGLCYLHVNQADNALKIFNKIAMKNDNPYSGKSLFQLGMSYFQKKDWENAIKFWKKYIILLPEKRETVQTRFMLANAYEMQEELKIAYDLYYSLLGDYPNAEVLKNRLKSLYNRRIARKR